MSSRSGSSSSKESSSKGSYKSSRKPDQSRVSRLCLRTIKDDGLVPAFVVAEAARPEIWASTVPSADVAHLAACFEHEWGAAIDMMLRHWERPPAWY